MPRYFYDVNNGHERRDHNGVDSSGPSDARSRALQYVKDYVQISDLRTANEEAVVVGVRDELGNNIVTVRLVLSIEA